MPIDLTSIQLPFTTIEAVENQIAEGYSSRIRKSGTQQLSQLTNQLGIVESGEIRLGNSILPGSGFSGLRMAYPSIETSEGSFHLGGWNNDQIQAGFDALNGSFGWGFSDGVDPNPDPSGFSGRLDRTGIQILYALDPTIVFLPGGGSQPIDVRSYRITDDLDSGLILSDWGVIHDSINDITYISFTGHGIDSTASQLTTLNIGVAARETTIDLDSKLVLSATYTTQVAPRFSDAATITLFSDGQNQLTSINLETIDQGASASANIYILPGTSILLNTDTDIPVDISQFLEIEEITAPTGSPAANKKWIYTTSQSDLIVEDESGIRKNLLTGGIGGVFKIVKSMPPATLAATIDYRPGGSTPAEQFQVWDFSPSTVKYMDFLCRLQGYNGGGITFTIPWSSDGATSGAVIWSIAVRRIDNGEDVDTSHTYVYQDVTSTTSFIDGELVYPSVSLTHGTQMDFWNDGELANVRIRRRSDQGGDTMNSNDAELWTILGLET